MKRSPFALSLVAALFLGAAPAPAQVVGDPDVVQSFMQTYGLQVSRDIDKSGDPRLSSRIEGTNFKVYFYGCTKQICDSIQFSAGFDMTKPMSAWKINEWNRTKRFGKAYLDDEGDPYIEYDVNLDFDGCGGRNFDDTIDLWRVVLSEFKTFIDW
ncbi:YbjN domain-containing protein [Rhodobacter maris]|uniref:Putative sensory transduction regulator n=1 Tax=Rhodobacter maris TaxID=446682 RepID=A0A285SYY8_9RHOB|nr:YbjN domain-containing protein [Rhodobacter maris]SOC13991.1 putative sensory transduction regulator [Rhodobacter maris]